MNESDNYALEEALLLKEDIQDSEIVVVSLGPERVKKIIREGLAKGADRGIHLNMNSGESIDQMMLDDATETSRYNANATHFDLEQM